MSSNFDSRHANLSCDKMHVEFGPTSEHTDRERLFITRQLKREVGIVANVILVTVTCFELNGKF